MSSPSLPPGLAEFALALRGEPLVTVPIDRCREVFVTSGAAARADDRDPRHALADALQALAAAGAIKLPASRSKHLWESERSPPLPVHVRRVRGPLVTPRAPRAPLHPTLARAHDLAGTAALPEGIESVDAWLKAAPARAALVPMQERSFEIFGDEKRLGALLATRFAIVGGLTAAALGCFRVKEPFVMTEIAPGAGWAIALENLATYDSVTRAAREMLAGAPAAVIFGRGNHFSASCASLPERLPSVRTVVYFGDLDRRGLEIPLAVREAVPGVAIAPWCGAYELLVSARPGAVRERARVAPAEAARVVQFLPEGLRGRAMALLIEGRRVPQEAVGRATIASMLGELGRVGVR